VSGLSQTNLTLPWTNRHNNSEPVALRYFAQLDLPTVQQLFQIYRIDFEMFGYDVQPYLDLFKP
jgi:Sulfotransferase family